jgi:predicted anti-sigma-YlaC factor YlaD
MGPECDRARARVSLRLDDELSAHEAVLLERHLSRCLPCAAFAREAGEYTELLRAAPLEPAPPFVLPRRSAAMRLSVRVGAAVGSTAAAALVAVSVMSFDKPSGNHAQVAALDFVPSGIVVERVKKDVPLGLRQASDLSPPAGRTQQGRLGSTRRGLVGS